MRYFLALLLLILPSPPPLTVEVNANPPIVAPGQSIAAIVGIRRNAADTADVSVRIQVDPDLEILSFGTWGDTCAREGQLIACVVTVRAGEGALIGLSLRAASSTCCAPYRLHIEARTKFSDEMSSDDLLILPNRCVLFVPLA